MSLRTVLDLNEEWHRAVAENSRAAKVEFPDPWCDGGAVDRYAISPITNAVDLSLEGQKMHHCVNVYASDVADGRAYIYSVTKDGERIATLELLRSGDAAQLGQLSGVCNAVVPKPIEAAVRKWWRSARKAVQLPVIPEHPISLGAVAFDDPDEIPF